MYKVLIAEDDVLISEHLKMIVEEMGHQVVDISSCLKDALNYLLTAMPDVALLDIRMHGVDEGIEIAKHLKSIKIPFVFITSFSDKNMLMNAVMQQPAGYVLKPYSKKDILTVFNRFYELDEDETILIT